MKELVFSVVTDIIEAEKIWRQLSPNSVVDDDWDFRYTFYKPHNYPLHFIVGYSNRTPVGLLPLQCNTDDKYLEFFGGIVMGDNKVFLAKGYEKYAQMFFDQVSGPAHLVALADPYNHSNAESYESKYLLDIEGLQNYEEYLQRYWSSKSLKQLKKHLRTLFNTHNIEIEENNAEDLELMFALNINSFGTDSSFSVPHRSQSYRDLRTKFQSETVTILVDGVKQAVSFGIVYKDTYRNMNTGTNKSIDNLGKLLNLQKINKAIAVGARVYEAGRGDRGWKEKFKFTPSPQYKLIIN